MMSFVPVNLMTFFPIDSATFGSSTDEEYVMGLSKTDVVAPQAVGELPLIEGGEPDTMVGRPWLLGVMLHTNAAPTKPARRSLKICTIHESNG